MNKEIEVLFDKIEQQSFEIKRLNNIIEQLKNKISELNNRKLGRTAYNNEAIIRLMYDMYLSGESFKDIENFLNANNILNSSGGKWNRSSIYSILKNDKNIKKYLKKDEFIIFSEQLKKKCKK